MNDLGALEEVLVKPTTENSVTSESVLLLSTNPNGDEICVDDRPRKRTIQFVEPDNDKIVFGGDKTDKKARPRIRFNI